MTQVSKHSELKHAIELFDAMVKDNLGYIYRGSFNDDITDSILDLTEISLKTEEHSSKIKKRVYAIMVEGLQNITRHQDSSPEIKSDHKSIFVIQKFEEKYFITTGNIIEKDNIENVKHLIEKINKLNKDELKLYYKQVLEEGTLSDKGGAGLGLIDMAKKSGNKLSYHFKPLSDGLFYFYLHTIPTLLESNDVNVNGKSKSLDHIVNVHTLLNQEDVLMIFNGIFNKESYSSLTLSLQKNISETKDLKNKLFYIIAEMLKNIVKHGYRTDVNNVGNPGVFYLSQLKDKYLITTGNYISNSKIKYVQELIKKINKFSVDKIDEEYKSILYNQSDSIIEKKQLGFIDIRKETGNSIHFSIQDVKDDVSFISLRVELDINH
jgi:hypothetical protein